MQDTKKRVPTRERLLQAATDVFAEKGYHDATVAEICLRANANIAALNYHLGDKAAAYREIYERAFAESLSRHPIDFDSTAAPLLRLQAHIASLLHRMNDDEDLTPFERIRNWELTRPTGLVDGIDYNVRKKSREHMLDCLRDILREDADEQDLLVLEGLVLGMTRIVLPFNRRDIPLLTNTQITSEMVDDLAKRITAVVVGGFGYSLRHRPQNEN